MHVTSELKSIISVEEKLWSPPAKIKSRVSLDNRNGLRSKRVPSIPKRYLPYQLDRTRDHHKVDQIKRSRDHSGTIKDHKKREDTVVCQSVGSNGTVFYVESPTKEDEVDVETVDESPSIDGTSRIVNLNCKQEEKEPVRKSKPSLKANNVDNVARGGSPQANTVAFVAILLHALKCSSCEKPACKKMRMVLQHYKQCAFKRKQVSLSEGSTGVGQLQSCKICSQLLKIVAQHAKNDCRMDPGQKGCPVLMCDNFRAAMHVKSVQNPRESPVPIAPGSPTQTILGQ